jgi:transcriptional regulator with XRE-family HTH domain
MIISPEQIRAARALLRLEQDELARRARVSVVTIRRLEAVDGASRVAPATVDGVRQALEAAGAEFLEGGVRRRPWSPEEIEERIRTIDEISRRSAERLKGQQLWTDDDLYDENGLPV